MGFTSNLGDLIESLGVAEGELDNMMEAAIRDVGEVVIGQLDEHWPVFGGPRPPSLRADSTRVPERGTVSHSRDLWRLDQAGKLDFFLINDASYSSFVHIKKGHPDGLHNDLIPEILDPIEDDPLAYVSDRVYDAIMGAT